jgi:hypothetical protein
VFDNYKELRGKAEQKVGHSWRHGLYRHSPAQFLSGKRSCFLRPALRVCLGLPRSVDLAPGRRFNLDSRPVSLLQNNIYLTMLMRVACRIFKYLMDISYAALGDQLGPTHSFHGHQVAVHLRQLPLHVRHDGRQVLVLLLQVQVLLAAVGALRMRAVSVDISHHFRPPEKLFFHGSHRQAKGFEDEDESSHAGFVFRTDVRNQGR